MFHETPEQRDFREVARAFFTAEMTPLVERCERDRVTSRELLLASGKAGFLGVRYPEEIGGGGGSIVEECIWVEEAAAVCCGLTSALMVQSGMATSPIVRHGTPEQIRTYAVPAIRGERMSAFALTEPEAGSDVLNMRTRARRDGDDWVITGTKMFITNAPACDHMIVAAYTEPEARGRGVSLFVVDRALPGVEVRKLDKHGHYSAETGEVVFDDVRVPDGRLIGERSRGYAYLLASLEAGRITHAARSLGVARAAAEAAVAYARERVAFGSPIVTFQALRHRLVDMMTAIHTARLHVYAAAEAHAAGLPCAVEASMAKLVAADVAVEVTTRAMGVLGGYGFMTEFPVERYHRDAMLFPVSEGTNDIQREVISKGLSLQTR